MLRFIAAAIAFVMVSGFSGEIASATQCRDSHGKFIKCPAPTTTVSKSKPCRDAKGKFIKCSSTKKM